MNDWIAAGVLVVFLIYLLILHRRYLRRRK